MLYVEGMDLNEASDPKECDICHYWYLLNKEFKFQPNVCNKYHLSMMSINLSEGVILSIKGSDYCCSFNGINKK